MPQRRKESAKIKIKGLALKEKALGMERKEIPTRNQEGWKLS